MSSNILQYISPEKVDDPKMLDAINESVVKGTPRAESQAIRARVPNVFWSFQQTWNDVFLQGRVDHKIKELCRVFVSQSVNCKYCGDQRSSHVLNHDLLEKKVKDLLDFEKSDLFDPRTKAALSLARAIIWDLDTDDIFWNQIYQYYTEEEIIELGYFIGFTMGQQRFNRLLNIDKHLGKTGFENNTNV